MLRPQISGLAALASVGSICVWPRFLVGLAACVLLAACGGGSGTSTSVDTGQKPDPVAVDLPIAYIKRPIPVDEDKKPVFPDLLDPTAFNPGAAIYVKERATALAQPVNITDAAFDKGALYDVKDLSTSPDGKKLLFSMHAPMLKNVTDDKQPKWQIWEYELTTKVLRPIVASSIVALQGHDVSPRYLPDGRILFSSTRQIRSKAILLDDGKPQFSALEEGSDTPAFELHSVKPDGTDIQQLTYNQSHDLQPTMLQNGKILYSHWDQFGTNKLSFYTANADGTQVERHYGYFSLNVPPETANAPRNRLFRPQEMPDGRIAAILKPNESALGGDMVVIDTKHFFENDLQIPAGGGTGTVAQSSISILPINIKLGATEFSEHGRYSALTPLFDGTNRLLVSWSECRLIEPKDKRLVPCTAAWLATAGVKEADPIYGIWVYNITLQTQQPVVLAEEGMMFSEPVSLEPRPAATYTQPNIDPGLAAESVGMIHIRSVYDMDGKFNNYGATAFTSLDQIIQAAPDQRPARFVRLIKAVSIPDDDTRDNLGDNTYGDLFNQFTNLREILGYAPVEPDGSVKIKVPADMAFTLEVLNKDGKRIGALHRNWLQVRPGEVRECNGCHNAVTVNAGHGRSDAELPSINKGAGTTQFTNTVRFDLLGTPSQPLSGETMAEFATHTTYCLIPGDPATCALFTNKSKTINLRAPSVDLVFDDEWTDPAVRPKTTGFAYRYKNLALVANDIHSPTSEACMENDGWSSLCRVTINYENHIQPIWERTRGAVNSVADATCIGCHTSIDAEGNVDAKVAEGQLELLGTKAANNQRMLSYNELTTTTNKKVLDANKVPTDNIPVCELAPADLYPDIDACVIVRDTNGVPTCAGVANCPFLQDAMDAVTLDTLGNPTPRTINIGIPPSMSRGSALASARFFNKFANFNAATDTVDHRGMLNPSELKLLSEWLDIGGTYYNNPFDMIRQ